MKKLLITLLKIGASAALLIWLVGRAGPQTVWQALAGADGPLISLAFTAFLLGVVIRAFRWGTLLGVLGRPVALVRLTYLYLVGLFFNQFLPTGMGGDVVKAAELQRLTGVATAVTTVVSERLMGLLGATLLALLAFPFTPGETTAGLGGIVLLTALGTLVATWLLLYPTWLTGLGRLVPLLRPLAQNRRVVRLQAEFARQGWRGLLTAAAITLPFALSNVITYWLISQALEVSIPVSYFLLVSPLISLVTLLPSINVMGVREGAYQVLFVPLGVSPALAIAMSLMYQALRLAAGLLGGALYLVTNLLAVRTVTLPAPPVGGPEGGEA
ncbi:MAG: lysylphosphatidylglycerol synthase transmembrane domain-containing protein [Chloroflexota bacterium]